MINKMRDPVRDTRMKMFSLIADMDESLVDGWGEGSDYIKYRDELEEIIRTFSIPEWLDPHDEKTLMTDGVDCLVTNGKDVGYISFYEDSAPTLYSQQRPFGTPTYWMTLPDPPRE